MRHVHACRLVVGVFLQARPHVSETHTCMATYKHICTEDNSYVCTDCTIYISVCKCDLRLYFGLILVFPEIVPKGRDLSAMFKKDLWQQKMCRPSGHSMWKTFRVRPETRNTHRIFCGNVSETRSGLRYIIQRFVAGIRRTTVLKSVSWQFCCLTNPCTHCSK